ncbi:cytochrome c1 [Phenylobacterium ferrooxidans]|uniref:Cytochrome c1 n=1 Tax=Phenylobacterium ferrooxidans TaxID=2982689 RepID=A0ABW6CJV6_9CAUL
MKTTRQVELTYMRVQTVIAAASVACASILSTVGIIIAVQFNEQNKAEKARDEKQAENLLAAERAMGCADILMKLSTVDSDAAKIPHYQKVEITKLVKMSCDGTGALISIENFAHSPLPSDASKPTSVPSSVEWASSGPIGLFNQQALQRGYKVYEEVCAECVDQQLSDVDAFLKWAREPKVR